MPKILLSIVIVMFSTFCGYVFTKKYRKKKKFFMQMCEFNERYLNEIAYLRRPLAEFVSQQRFKEEFAALLEEFFARLQEDKRVVGVFEENTIYEFLNKEEKETIEEYFEMLGKGDSISQKTYFSAIREKMNILRKSAEENCKKYGDLYIKLGFLCGLFIVILLF